MANPAAGAQLGFTVPDNARWRVRTMVWTLHTSAEVGDRDVSVYYYPESQAYAYYVLSSVVAQAADTYG
ncbi:unnamed protein product, partial [marine sediment metagenome]